MPDNQHVPARGTPLFQIYQDDLADLERILPELTGRLWVGIDNRTKMQIRRVQEILTNVRWNYGPPVSCEIIDPASGAGDERGDPNPKPG